MTTEELLRAAQLFRTLSEAKEWRETFEENKEPTHSIVVLGEISMTEGRLADARTLHGFDGTLELPRDLAILMMRFVESAARAEIRDLGVDISADELAP
jgi:hypothetical protein